MDLPVKKAVVLLAVGEKYEKLLSCNISQFKNYAEKHNADLVVIKQKPDSTNKRSFFYQKLLLPDQLKEYDTCVFFDIDILINPDCPSLFDILPDDKGFAAVYSPRGSDKFKAFYSNRPEILSETPETYFSNRNFPPPYNNLTGNINGGVFVFKPKLIAEAFKNYYFSDHSQGEKEAFEEAPMAYITQSLGLFFPLDEKFNTQFFYELYTPEGKNILKIKKNLFYKIINEIFIRIFKLPPDILIFKKLRTFSNQILKKVYILHFSGRMNPKLYSLKQEDK